MSGKQIDVLGGESIFCISQQQLERALAMFESEQESGERIRAAIRQLESTLSRNELAALAFVLIDRLRKAGPPA